MGAVREPPLRRTENPQGRFTFGPNSGRGLNRPYSQMKSSRAGSRAPLHLSEFD